jgi:hypothetical protein
LEDPDIVVRGERVLHLRYQVRRAIVQRPHGSARQLVS